MENRGESQASKQQWIAVEVRALRDATRDICFDVYLKVSEDNYAHVFSATSGLDYRRVAQYAQRGVKELFVRREEEAALRGFLARPAEAIFHDPATTPERKLATLLNMTEQNMSELFSQVVVSTETADYSRKLIRNYVELMGSSPTTLATLLKLVAHGDYLYYHSIAVAVFSMFLARASGQFNQKSLEMVGLGGFLHDLGCTQLPEEVVSSPTDLSPEQWERMREHPKLGLGMLEGNPSIPDEVRYIVYQHHEEPGGRGYPNAIAAPVIFYPAKIVGIADSFSALISRRPFRPAFTVDEALRLLYDDPAKYDRDLVKLLSGVLLRDVPVKKAA